MKIRRLLFLGILSLIASAQAATAGDMIRVGHFPNITHVQGLVAWAEAMSDKIPRNSNLRIFMIILIAIERALVVDSWGIRSYKILKIL